MNLNMCKKISLWILLALLLPALAGCFGVAVVGMGAGALMLSDRRPSETYVTDQGIELRASNSISEKYHDRVHVNVTSYNRTVLITGEVPDAASKADIEQIVAGKPNVKATQNELKISGLSALGGRSNDSLITSKVKGRFIDYGKFSANVVKVVTENGTVYLMGLVTEREADAATQIARETSGVLSVVRLFEYLTEQDAARLDNRPSNASK
jgi:osmotically-inducible protein OsmY